MPVDRRSSSLPAVVKRWGAILGLTVSVGGPLVAWSGRKFDSTLAQKLDKTEFRASRDTVEFRLQLDRQKHEYEFDRLFGVVMRMDSTVKRIERTHR